MPGLIKNNKAIQKTKQKVRRQRVTGASLLDECVYIFLPLCSSSSLQMLTLLSIEPVASKCDAGEKQHAVTYLQQ